MKPLSSLLLLPLLLLLTSSTSPDNAAKGRLVKKQLTALLAACRSNDYARAAKFMVYRGPDKRREWKDVFDYSKQEERDRVLRVCERINAHLALDGAPSYVGFTLRRQGKEEWGAWEVLFEGESQQERLLFAFVKVRGKYLLGDIDDLSAEENR